MSCCRRECFRESGLCRMSLTNTEFLLMESFTTILKFPLHLRFIQTDVSGRPLTLIHSARVTSPSESAVSSRRQPARNMDLTMRDQIGGTNTFKGSAAEAEASFRF